MQSYEDVLLRSCSERVATLTMSFEVITTTSFEPILTQNREMERANRHDRWRWTSFFTLTDSRIQPVYDHKGVVVKAETLYFMRVSENVAVSAELDANGKLEVLAPILLRNINSSSGIIGMIFRPLRGQEVQQNVPFEIYYPGTMSNMPWSVNKAGYLMVLSPLGGRPSLFGLEGLGNSTYTYRIVDSTSRHYVGYKTLGETHYLKIGGEDFTVWLISKQDAQG